MESIHIKVRPSHSNEPNLKPHRHGQRFASIVILNLVKLPITRDHHTSTWDEHPSWSWLLTFAVGVPSHGTVTPQDLLSGPQYLMKSQGEREAGLSFSSVPSHKMVLLL